MRGKGRRTTESTVTAETAPLKPCRKKQHLSGLYGKRYNPVFNYGQPLEL
jgi:hypothetical protein